MKYFSISKPIYMNGILSQAQFSTLKAANLTGIYYDNSGTHRLQNIYKKILNLSKKLPKNSFYKNSMEALICYRLSVVQESGGNKNEVESKICGGSIEMLIKQAEGEFLLVQKMILWKPWEPLVESAPPDQWKWPPC